MKKGIHFKNNVKHKEPQKNDMYRIYNKILLKI